jgi:hypothetical protein
MSTEPSREEITEAVPVPKPHRHRPACSHCEGDDVTKGLKLGRAVEVGDVGIKYESTGRFLGIALLGNEPLYLDVCNSCGTVTRIYVKDTQRKWC